jgi:type I restriction enzyme S subunit
MKTVQIKDLGRIITGDTPPRSKPELYGNHTPFIKATDISEDSKFTYNPEECYSEIAFEKYRKKLIPKGATCVNTIGSIGRKMTMAHRECFVNQAINAVISNEHYDNDYVYYLLRYNLPKVKQLDSGTASGRENVSKSAFSNIEISVEEDIDKQREIAGILSKYDELIENSRKQIALLEEAAQRLYREWFVDFRFPGSTSRDSLPQGWQEESVGSLLAKVHRTKQIPTSEMIDNGSIPVIDQSRNFIAGYTDDVDSLVKSDVPIIVFGDHTRVLKYIQFPFAKGADGTQLILSNDLNHMPQSLFYVSLVNVDLSNYSYARHFKYLKQEKIVVPTEQIAHQFDLIASNFFAKIQSNREMTNKLIRARDALLPKLMSGELKV